MATYIVGLGSHARMLWTLLNYQAECVAAAPDDADALYVGAGDPASRLRIWDEYYPEMFRTYIGSHHFYGATKGGGVHIMPGAVVMPFTKIGDNVLINTGAQVDHHSVVGAHSHIAPGAILCGNVTLGECCFIGAGAIVVQGVTLDAGTFIPAGTLVCGQDDLRRPQRALQRHGAAFVDGGEVSCSSSDLWRMGRRDYSDVQSEGSST